VNVSFKDFYNGIGVKAIVDKINGGSKNSKMSPADVATVNSVLNASGKSQIKKFCIITPQGKSAENSAQQAFVDLTKYLCEAESYFEKLKQLNWFYTDADLSNISNITKRYGKVREGSYIYKDAEVTLLMARSVKLLIDCGKVDALEEYSFSFEVKDESVAQQESPETVSEWLPKLEDYDPGITKEKWLELLKNSDLFQKRHLLAMACIYDNGGEGSCTGLAEKYNQSMTLWRTVCGVHLAEKIADITGCPRMMDEGKNTFFVIPFLYRKTSADEQGSFIYKLRPELYEALTEFNILEYLEEEEGEEELSIKETIDQIKQYIESRGFSYNDDLVENFYLSLKSKPFVILAGTSGTGKTKLVSLFAEAINAKYKLVSVRPDWSDSTDLFGHTNLKGEFIPGAITEFVQEAMNDLDYPYFLCLDEMNLARVEYYLSDFLSIIETRKRDGHKIITEEFGIDETAVKRYGKLYLPENLYIIGTVNMDETTFPFSKKVLDRANTIEFSFVNLVPEFGENEKRYPVPQNNSFLKTKYITLKTDIEKTQHELTSKICEELEALNNVLQNANAHVGYRVRDEIVFYMLNNDEAQLLEYKDALDNEIMQKILPRIQGSSVGVKELLCKLFVKFAGDYSAFSQDLIWKQMEAYIKDKSCTYRKSATKICYMMRRYEEDGFTSYWL